MNMSPTEDERYLPEEIITEVLARLPVKSIFQFRCVSKYWLHRIPNSNLISLHLNHTINFKLTPFNHTSPILTVQYESDSKYFNIHSFQNFKQSSFVMTTPPSYHPIVSNDGLVLMVDDVINPRDLILVNPTLKTWLLLPPCPVLLTNFCVVYAIGFAPTANDFKVLVFRNRLYTTSTPSCSAVYTLNNGCWTTKDMDFDQNYVICKRRTVFTKCKAHWWGTCHGYNKKVITFDIDAEKFSYLGLPLEYVNRVDGMRIRTGMDLFLLRGSLAILCVSVLGFYIWVLDDEVGHGGDHPMWRQFYHGVPTFDTIEFLLYIWVTTKFWFDDKCSKFYIHAEKSKLWSYDFRGDEFKRLGYSHKRIRLVDTYVESLLLCSQPAGLQ